MGLTTGPPVLPGGVVRVVCDDRRGQRVTADIMAEQVDQLKCGCWRIRTTRPGEPADDPRYDCTTMEVILLRTSPPCSHDTGASPGDDVPSVVLSRTAETADEAAARHDDEMFGRQDSDLSPFAGLDAMQARELSACLTRWSQRAYEAQEPELEAELDELLAEIGG